MHVLPFQNACATKPLVCVNTLLLWCMHPCASPQPHTALRPCQRQSATTQRRQGGISAAAYNHAWRRWHQNGFAQPVPCCPCRVQVMCTCTAPYRQHMCMGYNAISQQLTQALCTPVSCNLNSAAAWQECRGRATGCQPAVSLDASTCNGEGFLHQDTCNDATGSCPLAVDRVPHRPLERRPASRPPPPERISRPWHPMQNNAIGVAICVMITGVPCSAAIGCCPLFL